MRGWENVTLADVERRAAKPPPDKAKPQKYRAEPCIVTADGTLFTANDIAAVELAHTIPPVGTLEARARRCDIHGRWFASMKEGKRYLELKMLERSGDIADLRCQVEYDLTVISIIDHRPHCVGHWTADFTYHRAGQIVVEDTKSKATRTQTYRLRKKMFQAIYGLQILET